jgi:4-carboxymuconolactone decarboxylase
MSSDKERKANGERNRRKVLGDAHVERSLKGVDAFNADWVDFITRTAWGDIWQRPGLDWRARSIIVLSVATSLGRWEEFRIHVRGALANGLTRDEIKEVLMQCAIYAGVPSANHAFAEARKVFAEIDAAG